MCDSITMSRDGHMVTQNVLCVGSVTAEQDGTMPQRRELGRVRAMLSFVRASIRRHYCPNPRRQDPRCAYEKAYMDSKRSFDDPDDPAGPMHSVHRPNLSRVKE